MYFHANNSRISCLFRNNNAHTVKNYGVKRLRASVRQATMYHLTVVRLCLEYAQILLDPKATKRTKIP
jgi:hypothetical protein